MMRNIIRFYGELLAPSPTPNLEDHALSAVRHCLFAATHPTGGRFSNRNLRTRHAVVTGTYLSRDKGSLSSSISCYPYRACH
jgi:hypothetical protein